LGGFAILILGCCILSYYRRHKGPQWALATAPPLEPPMGLWSQDVHYPEYPGRVHTSFTASQGHTALVRYA
jgi:hypothetical protein